MVWLDFVTVSSGASYMLCRLIRRINTTIAAVQRYMCRLFILPILVGDVGSGNDDEDSVDDVDRLLE